MGRIEAFSDAVLAIILTVMVLDLRAPDEPGFPALWLLWPTFFAYGLSYAYVAIYWVNHHRLFSYARAVGGELLWSNIALLFTLSLLPFSTAYVGKHLLSPVAGAVYLVSLLSPSLAYYWLEKVICRTGEQSHSALTYYRATMRKCIAASAVYAAGAALSFVSPILALTIAGMVAISWILPWGPIDHFFLGAERE
ncbi:MAG: DUF1211 domain-containing protein [Novosphingobium sp.]|nr:DUF1211 domain-containing protein [Novosphingobium sp.]